MPTVSAVNVFDSPEPPGDHDWVHRHHNQPQNAGYTPSEFIPEHLLDDAWYGNNYGFNFHCRPIMFTFDTVVDIWEMNVWYQAVWHFHNYADSARVYKFMGKFQFLDIDMNPIHTGFIHDGWMQYPNFDVASTPPDVNQYDFEYWSLRDNSSLRKYIIAGVKAIVFVPGPTGIRSCAKVEFIGRETQDSNFEIPPLVGI